MGQLSVNFSEVMRYLQTQTVCLDGYVVFSASSASVLPLPGDLAGEINSLAQEKLFKWVLLRNFSLITVSNESSTYVQLYLTHNLISRMNIFAPLHWNGAPQPFCFSFFYYVTSTTRLNSLSPVVFNCVYTQKGYRLRLVHVLSTFLISKKLKENIIILTIQFANRKKI